MPVENPGWQIFLIVLFVVGAFAFFWTVGEFARIRYFSAFLKGHPTLESRFPEKSTKYNQADLTSLVEHESNVAESYIFPILFPLDLLVMLALSGSMALASYYFARMVGVPPHWAWLTLALPVIYLVFDLAEDGLLILMLKERVIDAGRVDILQFVTKVKLFCVWTSLGQTALFTGCGLIHFFRGGPAS